MLPRSLRSYWRSFQRTDALSGEHRQCGSGETSHAPQPQKLYLSRCDWRGRKKKTRCRRSCDGLLTSLGSVDETTTRSATVATEASQTKTQTTRRRRGRTTITTPGTYAELQSASRPPGEDREGSRRRGRSETWRGARREGRGARRRSEERSGVRDSRESGGRGRG